MSLGSFFRVLISDTSLCIPVNLFRSIWCCSLLPLLPCLCSVRIPVTSANQCRWLYKPPQLSRTTLHIRELELTKKDIRRSTCCSFLKGSNTKNCCSPENMYQALEDSTAGIRNFEAHTHRMWLSCSYLSAVNAVLQPTTPQLLFRLAPLVLKSLILPLLSYLRICMGKIAN
jgi:hypothetical protein